MNRWDSIQAVTFDVGGTLIRPWPSVGHVYAAVASEHGYPAFPPELLNRQFAAAWRRKDKFDHSRHAWRALVEQSFSSLLPAECVGRFFDDLYERFGRAAAWRVFDDVQPTFRALKARGFKLGAISNWDERLRPLLAELGLAPFFDAIVVSCEVGSAKPVASVFRHCVELLRTPARSTLHVGDHAEEDCAGAERAGLRSRLLSRDPTGPGMHSLLDLLLTLEKPCADAHSD
jgi:putative hydrolase of the HAD superfamily